jgi:hypothetical protein
MAFDPRVAAFDWAWTKGWKVELAGTTVTVRDAGDYVMAEMDFSHVRPDVLRLAVNDQDLQKSAIHTTVLLCGFSSTAERWRKSGPIPPSPTKRPSPGA